MTQLGLFLTTADPAEADAGIRRQRRAMPRLERNGQDFLCWARDMARIVCAERGCVSADDLRVLARRDKMEPHHCNAWGAVFKEAGWQCVGRQVSRTRSNNGREVRVWKWEGA